MCVDGTLLMAYAHMYVIHVQYNVSRQLTKAEKSEGATTYLATKSEFIAERTKHIYSECDTREISTYFNRDITFKRCQLSTLSTWNSKPFTL